MKRVLIIDEEKWYMQAILDRIDFEMEKDLYDYCYNGSDGLDLLKQKRFGVVILDMMVPLGENIVLPPEEPNLIYGILILRKIRAINKEVRVVCYTIIDEPQLKKDIKDLDGEYVSKLDNN